MENVRLDLLKYKEMASDKFYDKQLEEREGQKTPFSFSFKPPNVSRS